MSGMSGNSTDGTVRPIHIISELINIAFEHRLMECGLTRL